MTDRVHVTDAERMFAAVFGLKPEELAAKMRSLADGIRLKWTEVIRNEPGLRATKNRIAGSIEVLEAGPGYCAVAMTDALGNMIEQGRPPFDMRTTLLYPTDPEKAGRVKTSKSGYRYRAVPFRHQTPGSDGIFGQPMPAAVHAEAKKLRATLSGADAEAAIARLSDPVTAAYHTQRLNASKYHTLWGGIPELEPRKHGSLPEGTAGAEPLRPWHVTDRYAGMYRFRKTYAKAQGGHYMTFRMISENPGTFRDHEGNAVTDSGHPVANWMHPGFAPPLDTAGKVHQWLETEAIPGMFGGAE